MKNEEKMVYLQLLTQERERLRRLTEEREIKIKQIAKRKYSEIKKGI